MPVRRSQRGSVKTGTDHRERPDAELAADAADGNTAAFAALYRRHADAAWRVASAVASNRDDAADAVSDAFTKVLAALGAGRLEDCGLFRSYLLSATRNAAIDLHRRASRTETFSRYESRDGSERLDVPTTARTAGERVDDTQDAELVAEAFRGLPERWRSVLWLTEVEGIPAREAAALLGVNANTVSQLAVRARAGLRERFVQAHLRQPVNNDCRFCVDRLGGYVTGNLSPRDVAKVDQHLAGCQPCRDRAAELEDLGSSLRRVVLPLPLLLAPAAMAKFKLTAAAAAPASTAAAASGATGGLSLSAATLAKIQKPLLAASTGLFALGVISASVLGGPNDGPGTDAGRAPLAIATPPQPQIVESRATLATNRPETTGAPDLAVAIEPGRTTEQRATLPATRDGSSDVAPPGSGTVRPSPSITTTTPSDEPAASSQPTPTPPPGEPVVNAGVTFKLGPIVVSASVGSGDGSCSGVSAGPAAAGCKQPAQTSSTAGATVSTDGSAGGSVLNDRSVTVGV